MTKQIEVIVRSNAGDDTTTEVPDWNEAEKAVAANMLVSNHMIRVDLDGIPWKRWDRERYVGGNDWREVDRDEMEVLGPIREVHLKLS